MRLIKLSDEAVINLDQIRYCKMFRTPIAGHLVPQSLLQVFFTGNGEYNPVEFTGEEAERLWQAIEYETAIRPEPNVFDR